MSHNGKGNGAVPAGKHGGGAVAVVSTSRKVDDRIRLLLEDVVAHKHRGLVLVVGDRAKDQVVNLHTMLSRANHNAKVSVLWCMKDEPDFGSTSAKKQERRARREVKGGLATEATKEAFQTFLAQTSIRFCKYAETHAILGQTFGMAVLQDFESLTPNTLARTVETVSGGGLVVLVFRGLRSLKQLYTIAMDVHARYRTAAQRDVVPRFNERFVLSLTDCDTALCVDDDLNVLPITHKMHTYGSRRSTGSGSGSGKDTASYDKELVLQGQLRHEAELAKVKTTLQASSEVGPLVQLCQTMDQAKTVLALMQAVTEKSLDATCVVTASRGRGKSAALGIAAAGAIAQGYSNILCTAPSPENVQTFFEFVVRGLCVLGYTERVDYEALRATSDDFSRCLIRVNVFRAHRQTVQFVDASDAALFAQAEIAIIDEAAALPLTLVRQMLGPYLVFLSSTVAGYEGTGRSLSLKLVADMRKRSGAVTTTTTTTTTASGGVDAAATAAAGSSNSSATAVSTVAHAGRRVLRELVLSDPIRYGPCDPVERWLHKLLCLDATTLPVPLRSTPHPDTCELFYVDRDALFSYHPLAEALLQRVQALLVAAHYKNQPNDLQLLSDAPGHHLFVLCSSAAVEGGGGADVVQTARNNDDGNNKSDDDDGSASNNKGKHTKANSTAAAARQLPDVYCVVHVCEEGQLSAEAVKQQLSRGLRPSGDLIPYTLSQYYLEDSFAQLAGVRVVRVATHPDVQRGGYGSRAVQLLRSYYAGNIAPTPRDVTGTSSTASATTPPARRHSSGSSNNDGTKQDKDGDDSSNTTAAAQSHTPRAALLTPLAERPYEVVDYVGVSFGLTSELFAFWQRSGFVPLYVRQAAHELTGEHSCVMVHPLGFDVAVLQREFVRRFVHLLAAPFRRLPTALALCVLLGGKELHNPQHLAQVTEMVGSGSSDGGDGDVAGAAAAGRVVRVAGVPQATAAEAMAAAELTPSDLQRLRMYATAFVEGGGVLDLVPRLSRLYFAGRLHVAPDGSEGVVLTHAQAAVLLAVGLQCITLEELSRQSAFANVSVQQLRAFYHKALARITEHLVRLTRLEAAHGKRPRAHDDDKTTTTRQEQQQQQHNDDDDDDDDGDGETTVERYDEHGKLVGLSVARSVRSRVSADSTLLRDASGAVMGANDAAAHKDLQHVFHRPRKASRRRA